MSRNENIKSVFSKHIVKTLLGIHKPVVKLSDIMDELPEPDRKKYKLQLEKYKRDREIGQGGRKTGQGDQGFGSSVNISQTVGSRVTTTPVQSHVDGAHGSVPDFDTLATDSIYCADELEAECDEENFAKALDLKPRTQPTIIFRPWLDGDEQNTIINVESSRGNSCPQGSKVCPLLVDKNQAGDPLGINSGTEAVENVDYGAIINEFIESWEVPDYVLAELERDLVYGMPGPLAVLDLTPEDFEAIEIAEREEGFALAEDIVCNEITKSMRIEPHCLKSSEGFNPPQLSQVLSKEPEEFVKIVQSLGPLLENSPKSQLLQKSLPDLNRSDGGDDTNQLQTLECISNEPNGRPVQTCSSASSICSPGPSQVTTITMDLAVRAPQADQQLQYNMERSLKKAKKYAGDDQVRKLKINQELRKLKQLKALRQSAPDDLPPLKSARS